MNQTQDPGPGLSRAGANLTIAAPDDVLASWEAGYAYAADLIADALDDARYAIFPLPEFTHEERVQQRIELFEQCAAAVARQIREETAGTRRPGPWRCTW